VAATSGEASTSAGATASGAGAPAVAPTQKGKGTPTSASKTPLDLKTKVGSAPQPSAARGFQYTGASKSAIKAAAEVGRQYSQVTSGRVVRGVIQGSRRAGDVISFGIKAEFAKNMTFRGQFSNALIMGLAGSQAVVSHETVGETGITVATGTSKAAVGWLDGSTVYVMVVPVKSLAGARAYVSVYPRAS
jgi:hypothetical protein